MRNLLSQLLAVGPELAAFILTAPILVSRGAHALQQTQIPSPNLDLSDLGRVAVVGDFDTLSVYSYEGQNANILNNNGSQYLLTQYPDGDFDALALADAFIQPMCQFERDGKVQGVVVGGNFTSLGGVQAQSIALWNPSTNKVTALPGIHGLVSALYCDNDAGTVYVGGLFTAGNSTNAMAWTTGWTNLPFAGFNGPVNSITKNSAGNIVFGGEFDGVGNTTSLSSTNSSSSSTSNRQQVINLSGGNVSAVGSTSLDGFSDPNNIICKTGNDGPGNTWLLSDNRGGYWQGTYSFNFSPTKLRLYNTNYQGRGTKSFSYEDLDSGGFLQLNYTDANGQAQSCAGNCPLPEGDTSAQDFYFTPSITMGQFRIWVNDWYGDGGGFSGIELFQDDIYSFAVNDFNEPQCDDVSSGSSSTSTPDGFWSRVASQGSTSDFLSGTLTDASQVNIGTSVVFQPDIQQSGNYSIMVYTPGCLAYDTCSTRGLVNMTGSMTSGSPPISTTVSQTNNYDKFDQIYYGYVDAGSFAPTITLSPAAGQPLPQNIVAQRVSFQLVTTTGGLNGLFEYNPNKVSVGTDFSNSAIDAAGASLDAGAVINSVVNYNSKIYAAGSFSGNGMSNIMRIGNNASSLSNGGLNGNVQTMYASGSTLYLGGNFTDTAKGSITGLANVATFDMDSNTWSALGSGVDGPVYSVVDLELNVTVSNLEHCVALTGSFSNVNSYGGHKAFSANGFAVWVPSKKQWLHNIASADIEVSGQLYSSLTVSGLGSPLYAGQLSSRELGFDGAAEIVGSGTPSLQSFGVSGIQSSSSSSSKRKRATSSSQSYSGVSTGLFYNENNLNITILGGNFEATASDGSKIENLIFIQEKGSKQTVSGISGLDSNSTITALAYQNTLLFAGGSLSGTIDGNDLNGLVVYDLQKAKVASPQPPALAGGSVTVNAIAMQDGSSDVYVGGSFKLAGSLPCATLCYYDTSIQQWNTPGLGLSGTITSMTWSSKTTLIIAGDLTVHDRQTSMATYDSQKQTYTPFTGASGLPGSITAIAAAQADYSSFWAAGTATNNNSAYLSLYTNNQWTPVSGLGPGTTIRGLQVLPLTSSHASTTLVPNTEVLMLIGNIALPTLNLNASAALFNGTAFTPFLLASNSGSSSPATIAHLFVSNPQNLMDLSGSHLALGFIVLIGLAIALALTFLLVVAGIFIERARRRREGYVPMSGGTSRAERNGMVNRLPPETLLGAMREKDGPPKV